MKLQNKKLISVGFFLSIFLINIFIFLFALIWTDLADAFRPSTTSTNFQYILLIFLPIQIYLLWKNRLTWKLLVLITIGAILLYVAFLLTNSLTLGLTPRFMFENMMMRLGD